MSTPDRSEFVRYLPLSARQRVDESAVTSDWAARLDDLEKAVAALGPATPQHFAYYEKVARARQRRRVRVADLGAALVEAYALGNVAVDGVTTGAVALARALVVPLPMRAVVRGSTLRATDADWAIGAGPEIPGTARELVLFLYGRAGLPGA